MRSIAQRKPYTGRIYAPTPATPDRRIWIGRFATKRERDKAVRDWWTEHERETNVENITIGDYAERYLTRYERTRKFSSFDTVRQRLSGFVEEFRDRPMRSFSRLEAHAYADRERWRVQALSAMFAKAVDDELLDRNPFRGLTPSSAGRSKQEPPTAAELDALLVACSVLGEYGPRMRALIMFAAYTGMRPGEIFALEWGDVDLERHRIFVQRRVYRGRTDTPKSNKPKLIALTPPARDALIGQPRTGTYAFTGMRGDRLSSTTLRRYWRDVCVKAGLDFDFYLATKHYCVRYLYVELGLEPRVIAAQMGWSLGSVLSMIRIYGHGDSGALDAIDRAFRSNVVQLGSVSDAPRAG